jgi:hypothetical protein
MESAGYRAAPDDNLSRKRYLCQKTLYTTLAPLVLPLNALAKNLIRSDSTVSTMGSESCQYGAVRERHCQVFELGQGWGGVSL